MRVEVCGEIEALSDAHIVYYGTYYALRRDHARGVGMDDGRFRTFVVVVAVVVVAGVVVGVEDVDFFLDLAFGFCFRFGAASAATGSSSRRVVDFPSLLDFDDFGFFFPLDFFFPPPVVARWSCARFFQMYSKSAVDFLVFVVVVDSILGVAGAVVLPSSRSRSSAFTNDTYSSSSSIVPALSGVPNVPNTAPYVSGVHSLGARSTLAVVVSAASSSSPIAFPSSSLALTRNVVP